MATVNDILKVVAVGGAEDPGNYNMGPNNVNSWTVKSRYFDTSVNGLDNGEYYKIFSIEAGTLVRAHAVCIAAEGAADTIDIALVADTDTGAASPKIMLNDFSVNSANTPSVYLVHNTIQYASAASTVCILANAALGTTTFYVVVETYKLNTDM